MHNGSNYSVEEKAERTDPTFLVLTRHHFLQLPVRSAEELPHHVDVERSLSDIDPCYRVFYHPLLAQESAALEPTHPGCLAVPSAFATEIDPVAYPASPHDPSSQHGHGLGFRIKQVRISVEEVHQQLPVVVGGLPSLQGLLDVSDNNIGQSKTTKAAIFDLAQVVSFEERLEHQGEGSERWVLPDSLQDVPMTHQ